MRYHEVALGAYTRKDLLSAILRHVKTHIDSYHTRDLLNRFYRELKSNLVFPLKIYRGYAWDEVEEFHDMDDEEAEAEKLRIMQEKIDFSRLGVYWTWDKKAALVGGALNGGGILDTPHLIIEAEVSAKEVDFDLTLIQNLVIHQEEKEVRLWANRPLRITNSWPALPNLPEVGNTGDYGNGWASRLDTLWGIFGNGALPPRDA